MSIEAKPWPSGGGASVVDASETTKGIIRIATSAEAATGTDDLTAMTPLTVKERIDAALVGGVQYQGTFDATAGTPSIANAEKGDLYIIDTAGTIYGQTWAIGDHLLINEDMGGSVTNSKIDKIDNTDAVTSLDDLSDVTLSSVAGGDLLQNNGSGQFVNVVKSTIDLSSFNDDLTYIGAVVEDSTPQLGGPLDVNGQAITSASNGDVTINPDGTGDIRIGADMIPDADATHTIGDENNRFISAYTDINGAIRFKAKNDSGGVINKGQAVYIKGVSGTVPTVDLAQANSSSTMPAFGLALANSNDQADVEVITFGNLTDYNTTTYSLSANNTVYVSASTAGGLTNSAPAGESNLIQNIGRVVRADASAGIIKVGGAGRSNATPNLNNGNIFLGNASNQAVSTAISTINLSSFNNDLGLATVATTGAYSDLSGTPTLATVATTGAYSDLSGTPTLATVATTGAYSDLSGTPTLATVATTGAYSDLSGTPTIPADLDDLSDVTITGTPASGEILEVNGSNQFVNVAKSSINLSEFNDDLSYQPLDAGLTSISGLTTSADKMIYTTASDTYAVADLTSAGRALLDDADASAQRTTLGLGTAATSASTDFLASTAAINDLSDVAISSVSNGQVLSYNSTSGDWENTTPASGGATDLDGLSDVTITSVTGGDLLQNNGLGQFVNVAKSTINLSSFNDDLSYQPLDAGLTSISGLTTAADKMIYTTASDTYAVTDLTSAGRALLDDADASAQRTTLGLGTAATSASTDFLASTAAINDLSDVAISSVSNGQVLSYNSTSGDWENTTLSSGGGGGFTYSAVSTATTAQAQYYYSVTGTTTITLPAATGITAGQEVRVKNMGTNTVTVSRSSTDTIDGQLSITMAVQYQALNFISNGSNGWEII